MTLISTLKNNKYINIVLAGLTIILLLLFVILRQTRTFNFNSYLIYTKPILSALLNTALVSIISLFGSLVFGFIFYLLSKSKIKYFNYLVAFFREIIYGTPLLVLIVVTAFLIGPAFGSKNRTVLGVIALITYMTPYMMNVFQSAISSISEEQYLAIDLFGFSSFDKYRYIIIPQVIRVLMPPMMNNFSLIKKGSALLNVLAFNELFYQISVIQPNTFAYLEGYLIMWALYLVITIPLSMLSKYIERKWSS